MHLKGIHIKMARAATGLGVRELGKIADVNPNTITRYENGSGANISTVEKIQAALENLGVRFGNDGAVYPPQNEK